MTEIRGIETIEIQGEYRKLGLTKFSLQSALPQYVQSGPMWTMAEVIERISDSSWTPAVELFGDDWIRDQDGRGACFPAGTRVTLANGELVPIENVRFGQLVRTHRGNNRQCVDTMCRSYTGDMVTLEVKGWQKLRLTGDHRVWVNDREWKQARDIQKGDEVSLVKNRSSGETRFIDVAYWVGGELVEDGAKIGCIWSSNYLPRHLELDDEFCWMLGLYCAEGSSDSETKRLCLTSHRDETAWRARAKAFFERYEIPVAISHRSESKACNLRAANSVVARLFEALCGKFANKKRIPLPILTGSREQKLAFLRGYFAGDGHVGIVARGCKETLDKAQLEGSIITKQVQAMCCTVSPILAQQVATMMVDIGIKPGFGTRKQRDRLQSYNVYVYGQDAARLLGFTYDAPANNFDKVRQRRNLEHSQLRPVKCVTTELVENEIVYDITVDQDHAFVAGGIAVHNCAGYAAASALERARAKRGLKFVELSGDGAYAAVNDGVDRGSGLEENMQNIVRNGIPPASEVPRWEYRRNRIPNKAYKEAKRFRGFEAFSVSSELELACGIAAGFAAVVAAHAGNGGRSPDGLIDWKNGVGNHSIVCDDLRYRHGHIEFQIANSWGLRWGERGRGWLTWRDHLSKPNQYHKFYCIRSTIDDPEGDNPPTPDGEN